MPKLHEITEGWVKNRAVNDAAFKNAKGLSDKNKFLTHCVSADESLIFGECAGSGKTPYSASVDFSADPPVSRCSCPSRQFPCKHCLALMLDFVAGKEFASAEIPDDIAQKREKLSQRAEKAAASPAKPNTGAAAKKLKKQQEGLALAEQFLRDIFSRGISAVNPAAKAQYLALAKQLGDYYLPEPQAIMNAIIEAAEDVSEHPDDAETKRIIGLCVRLSTAVQRANAYIAKKLESGEVLPEDDPMYETMGGVWKLAQLRDLGLVRMDVPLVQLAFVFFDDTLHKQYIECGFWIDLNTGDIFRTENKRPYRAVKHIAKADSTFEICTVPELCLYPGGLNRRVRWESAAPSGDVTPEICGKILSLAQPSIAEGVKLAKNALKDPLSAGEATVLLPFTAVEFAEDRHGVLICGSERIALCATNPTHILKLIAGKLSGGAMLCNLCYLPETHRIVCEPMSIVTNEKIIRLNDTEVIRMS
ncbi:MAG TPA: hypothetical protein DDX71_02310 [Ruminococcus sp.]|nr:hypothetical protein [Ruminococcus sp.]